MLTVLYAFQRKRLGAKHSAWVVHAAANYAAAEHKLLLPLNSPTHMLVHALLVKTAFVVAVLVVAIRVVAVPGEQQCKNKQMTCHSVRVRHSTGSTSVLPTGLC